MSSQHITVSIGLPVYNGENYLAEAIESVLAQTYTDFELIISDNCSSDGTEEICRRFAAQDGRIRYVRAETNRGSIWNFNRALELARGEFFQWMAHDDLVAPTYVERCLEALGGNPDAVLAMPRAGVIDDEGALIVGDDAGGARMKTGEILTDEVFPQRWSCLTSPRAECRYLGVLIYSRRCYELFGVIRTAALRRVLYRPFPNAEKVVLAELSLLGRFVQVPEVLFYSRWHSERFSNQPSVEARVKQWNPGSRRKFVLPHQPQCAWGYLLAPWRQKTSWFTRLACAGVFARFVFQVHRWGSILMGAIRGDGMTVTIPEQAVRSERPVTTHREEHALSLQDKAV